ncbi:hypothetical protein HanHA300_Chr05g0190461 [Helianthus annuus]|nr:hypothetical protein HanHA300_Chr05g0190461 [Helianthus annuus]KAJ0578039.1 hypothetical protein HanIR_Chr05g0242901 [Helianthus annuus]
MSKHEQTQSSIDLTSNESIINWIIGSATDANPPPPQSTTAQVRSVPSILREKHQYDKYFVPHAVSIGPYHFGEPKLQLLEKRKPDFAMKLFSNDMEALASLYIKLGEASMLKELRSFYEENTTSTYSDKVFTRMMLLDSCFILYFISSVFNEHSFNFREIKSDQIFLVSEDLFMFENQIPYKLLSLVMSLAKLNARKEILWHIRRASMLGSLKPKRNSELFENEPDHLLHLLHRNHTPDKNVRVPMNESDKKYKYQGSNFPNVNQLLDVGIRFRPCDPISLENVAFSRGWYCEFSAAVRLPPVAVDYSTKLVLLNLIAYEMRTVDSNAPFMGYVCLLQLMIINHEDVKVLRDAGVLESYLGTDNDVVNLFNDVASDLVPHNADYSSVKEMIQRHHENWSNTPISLVMHEYRKSPWKFISLLGALIALFLTGVQTYFTVWSLK